MKCPEVPRHLQLTTTFLTMIKVNGNTKEIFGQSMANGDNLLHDNTTPKPVNFGKVREHRTPVQMVTSRSMATLL